MWEIIKQDLGGALLIAGAILATVGIPVAFMSFIREVQRVIHPTNKSNTGP